jgi:D-alanyl-D-alanine carboxypeptidase (penicillin-binding protein 5/6)
VVVVLVAVLTVTVPDLAVADSMQPPTVTIRPPDTNACPQKSVPPPAVDTSERVALGLRYPEPLPAPTEPVGGVALGACGFVLPASAPPLPSDITATAWMVADLTTNGVVGGKDLHGRYRPASTQKLLTLLVMARNLTDWAATVVGTAADAAQEGSRVGLGPGGIYTVRDLLLGLVMNSGNDCAHALAVANGGVAKTLAQMNATAAALGALDTRAATVSGLDGPGQQTSAYDLGLVVKALVQQPGVLDLLGTRTTRFPGFGTRPEFTVTTDNRLLDGYQGALAGKTGFTDDAHNTFVGVAERDGHRLVVTMLAGTQWPRRQWMQAASLLDWGFAAVRSGLEPVGTLVDPGVVAGSTSTAPGDPGSALGTGPAPTPTAAHAATASSGGSALVWVLLLLVAVGAVVVRVLTGRRAASVTTGTRRARPSRRSRPPARRSTGTVGPGWRSVTFRKAPSTSRALARQPQRRPRRTALPVPCDLPAPPTQGVDADPGVPR